MKNNDYLSLKNVFILSVAASPLLITIYFLIYISSAKMAEYSNLVISIATVFATLIHYSSTKQQQIERRFEAEKQREGANKRGNSSRLTQSFHFFSLSRSFLP